ncbi:hypothetical protein H8959_016734 [Pygathrix nigripes]
MIIEATILPVLVESNGGREHASQAGEGARALARGAPPRCPALRRVPAGAPPRCNPEVAAAAGVRERELERERGDGAHEPAMAAAAGFVCRARAQAARASPGLRARR